MAVEAHTILLEFTEALATLPRDARTAIAAADLVVEYKGSIGTR